jgi:hypothetical protein
VDNSLQIKYWKEQNTGMTEQDGSVRCWKTSRSVERIDSKLKKEVLWEDGRE